MGSVDLTAERTTIACTIISANGKSMDIALPDGRRVWLPLDQVRVNAGGSVTLPEYLARERGLIR